MATVDFSKDELLADLRVVIGEEFVRERVHTRSMVREMIDESFLSFVKHNFDPAIESLQEQINELKQAMGKSRVAG